MPTLAMPPLPARLQGVVEVLGISRSRLAVLVALQELGGTATTVQIHAAVDVGRMTLSRALSALEAEGIVVADRSAGPSRSASGPIPVTWTVRPEALRDLLADLVDVLLPTTSADDELRARLGGGAGRSPDATHDQ